MLNEDWKRACIALCSAFYSPGPSNEKADGVLGQLRAYEELLSRSSGSLSYKHQIQLNAITESLAMRALLTPSVL